MYQPINNLIRKIINCHCFPNDLIEEAVLGIQRQIENGECEMRTEDLRVAFIWDDTEEGYSFWSMIHQQLRINEGQIPLI